MFQLNTLIILLLLIPICLAIDCKLPRDSGTTCPENAPSRQFYYDSRMKVCQPFSYKGCGGNENRFSSAQECKDTCKGKPKSPKTEDNTSEVSSPNNPPFVPKGDRHDQWRKAEICGSNYLIPNGKYIVCGEDLSCPMHHNCINGACCPTKDYVCSLRDDNGNFMDGIEDRPRFAWNHEVHSCVRYSYYGANGNYNNFPNFPSCMKYCQNSNKVDV